MTLFEAQQWLFCLVRVPLRKRAFRRMISAPRCHNIAWMYEYANRELYLVCSTRELLVEILSRRQKRHWMRRAR